LNHWGAIKIEDIATKVGSGSTPRGGSESYKESGTPLIRSMNIHFNGIHYEGLAYIDDEQADSLKNVEVFTDDVLLNITGASIGRVTQAPKEMNGARVNQHVCIIRPRKELNPTFLSKYLASPSVQRIIMSEEYGVTRQALTKQAILNFEIPLPPLNEQRRIVSTIEQMTDRSHKARTALADVPKLIEQFRQSVLAAAFRGDLTADWREKNPDIEPASELLERIKIDRRKRWEESSKSQYKPPQDIETDRLPKLPESWSWGSLDQLLYSLRNGLSRKPADEMPGIPILRISALRSMNLDTDDIRFYRPQDNENLESYFLDEGDLLFTRYNGNREFVGVCGRVNQISGKLLHPDKLIRGRVISGDLFDSHFLEIVCNSGISKKHIESYVKTSAGQHGISGSDLKTTPIPIPPIYEQRKIVEIVTMQLSTIKSIEDIAASYFIDSQQLDRSILAKAFRGELVPQDPNDEPVAVLLDRIRAEREKTSTPKQRGKTTRKNSSKQLSIEGIE
jgi:type I restriction enzyme, S subunit